MRARLLTRVLETRPALLAAALFGMGVTGGVLALVPYSLWLIPGMIFLAAAIALLATRKRSAALALALASLLFFGAWRGGREIALRPVAEPEYDVEISGAIADLPIVQEDQNRLVCRLSGAQVDGKAVGGDIRLYLHGGVSALRDVRYGQRIELIGVFYQQATPTNPGEFDFGLYLWRNGLYGYAVGELSASAFSDGGWKPLQWVFDFRVNLQERIGKLFPRSADIVTALVLSDRTGMEDDVKASFSRAGIMHLLAISGLHITLIAGFLSAGLNRVLPRHIAFIITMLALLLYGAMIGFSASVTRAIIMFFLLGAGPVLGRMPDGFTRLGLAFGAMLMVRPLYVLDAGFVLSFSAVAGLMCLNPLFSRPFRRLSERRSRTARALGRAGGMLSQTLAAEIGTLPAMAAYYGTFPLLGALVNLVAVPLCMGALTLALLSLLVSFPLMELARLVAQAPDALFQLLAEVAKRGAELPWMDVRLNAFPALFAAAFVLILIAVSPLSRCGARRKWLMLLLVPALALTAGCVNHMGRTGLEILFLDVGQGNGALLLAGDNRYMVDVGPWGGVAAEYIEREGIHLNGVFLSHPHADHAGGLARILMVDSPDAIYLPAHWFEVEMDAGLMETLEMAQDMGAEILEVEPGDVIALSSEVECEVLAPSPDIEPTSVNGISMVLQVRYGSSSALFTGDLPGRDEPMPLPDSDVLQVAHHGASGSTSAWQVAAVSPSVAVVQVGKNSYGHPNAEVLRRLEVSGAAVYRTDLDGAVWVKLFQDGRVSVRTTRVRMEAGTQAEEAEREPE